MEVDQEYITDESTAAAVSEYLHRFVARADVPVPLSARASKNDGFNLLRFSRDLLRGLFNGPGDDPHVQSITQSLYDALHPVTTSSDDDDELAITEQSTPDTVRRYLHRFIRAHDQSLTLNDRPFYGDTLLGLEPHSLKVLFNKRPSEEFLGSLYHALHPQTVSANTAAASAYPERDVLADDFTTPFVDPHDCLGSVATYIRQCSAAYRAQHRPFMSPYTSCVQSTLNGKSRTFRELARHHFRTVYFCFRKSGSTGYPDRTDMAINTLLKGYSSEGATPKKFSRVLSYRLGQLVYRAVKHLPDPAQSNNRRDDLQHQAEFPSQSISEVMFSNLPETHLSDDQLKDLRNSSPEIVLVVMDEARQLLTQSISGVDLFRCVRHAALLCDDFLKNNAIRISIFLVFIDTSSQIQNFSPAPHREPSARPSSVFRDAGKGPELFQPIVLRGSFDVHFASASTDLKHVDWSRLRISDDWLKTGRAGLSIARRLPEQESLEFLQLKLAGGGNSVSKGDSGAGRLANLALFLSRVAAMVYPSHPFASALVAGFMGTLLDTDLDREQCLISFMPEAMVARAAAHKWHEEDGSTFSDAIIPAVHDSILSGALNKGFIGEVIAQTLFLFACDRACTAAGKRYGSVVDVVDVLVQLLPSASSVRLAEEAVPPQMRGAMIGCGQFVNLAFKPDLRTHVQLAERHCFCALPEGFPGWDLFGPAFLPSESCGAQGGALGGEPQMEAAPSPSDSFGVVGIQVKACFGSAFSKTVKDKMTPSTALNGCFDTELLQELDRKSVLIFMNVDNVRPSAQVATLPNGRPVLRIEGLGSRCLPDNVRDALRVLLDCRLNYETFLRGKEEEQEALQPSAACDRGPYNEETIRSAWPFVVPAHRDYGSLPLRALRRIARDCGISGDYSVMTKATLLDAIRRAQQPS
ncbi:unnamed protein product (mitochondrion) [Plasmodiophora brassicae]|uniref:Uncharacterized protein n=1 Tax=Plasmodiophora brassicae TaxID=37360 RepID=A0A0G4IKJ0_PLABS|nr:hypothetical protein PBRA_004392 [Plasmodiophora brassicae]SPQ99928.1 unnamed protein product [Plasmodiophora brassicae]